MHKIHITLLHRQSVRLYFNSLTDTYTRAQNYEKKKRWTFEAYFTHSAKWTPKCVTQQTGLVNNNIGHYQLKLRCCKLNLFHICRWVCQWSITFYMNTINASFSTFHFKLRCVAAPCSFVQVEFVSIIIFGRVCVCKILYL